MTFVEIISELKEMANPEKVAFKQAKFGVVSNNALGIYHKDLNKRSIEIARQTEKINSKSAKWIASNALKELERGGIRMSDYSRSVYRKES